MSAGTVYELIGYTASVLIIVSLAMSSVVRLRVINLMGALTFSVYGLVIRSLPVLITNVIISGIDIYYLNKELSTREEITVISVNPGDAYVAEFLTFHADDIARFRPQFDPDADSDVVFLMLRDVNPVGVFIASARPDGVLDIHLDYVAPPYRDLRSGASLYGRDGERFRHIGWHTLVISDIEDRQVDYFTKMEFVSTGSRSMVRYFDRA